MFKYLLIFNTKNLQHISTWPGACKWEKNIIFPNLDISLNVYRDCTCSCIKKIIHLKRFIHTNSFLMLKSTARLVSPNRLIALKYTTKSEMCSQLLTYRWGKLIKSCPQLSVFDFSCNITSECKQVQFRVKHISVNGTPLLTQHFCH